MQNTKENPPPPARKPHVLVVDDEPENLSTMARVFRKEFLLTLASSGSEALKRAAEQKFDVALVDYSMPDMDGIEVLKRLAVVQPSTSRIIVTAHDQLEVVVEAKSSGVAISVIPKPWQKETILKWIDNAMKLSSMRSSVDRMRGAK